MKKTQIIILGIFVALLIVVCVIVLPFGGQNFGGNSVREQSNQKLATNLVAGGRQWKLSFADQSLPSETQQRINYDLNLVFGHMTAFVIDVLDGPAIASVGSQFDRRIRFEGGSLRRPLSLKSDTFGCLFRGGSDSEIYVPKSVTDAYLKAIKLEEQNKSAFHQLDEFLKRMSQLQEHPIKNVRELFVLADDFKSAEEALAAITADNFAKGWGGKVYRSPSILDVTSTVGTEFEKYGSLIALTYAMSAGKMDELPPLVYQQGQWKFLIQRPPT